MPKQSNYQGALDSIYNVIFSQADKPPKKKHGGEWAKKVPGDPFSAAITDIVAKPWLFWGNTVKEIADGLHDNVKLTNFWNFSYGFTDIAESKLAQQEGRRYKNIDTQTGKATPMKARDVLSRKFLSNPLKFVEESTLKAFEEYRQEKKKYALVGMLGGATDFLVGYGYAKKVGMDSDEAWQFGMSSGYFTKGAGQARKRLELKAENAVVSVNAVRSLAEADSYKKHVVASLASVGLTGFYDADVLTDISPGGSASGALPADILNKMSQFRNDLASRLASSGVANAGVLADQIRDAYADELKIYGGRLNQPRFVRAETTKNSPSSVFDTPFTPGAYRESIIRNREQKILLLERELQDIYDPAIGLPAGPIRNARVNAIKGEIKTLSLQAEFADALQKIHGDHDDYVFNFSASLERVDGLLADPSLDAATRGRLETLRGRIKSEEMKFMERDFGNVYKYSQKAGGDDPWRDHVGVGYAPNLSQKNAIKAYRTEIEAREIHLNAKMADPSITPEQFNMYDAKLASLRGLRGRLDSVDRSGARNVMGNAVASYHYAKALMKGEIFSVKGFMNGLAFWQMGIYSPGGRADFIWNDGVIKALVLPKEYEEVGMYRFMTGGYYLRPGSIMNTLFYNGEGYAYMAHMMRERMVKRMMNRLAPGFFDPTGAETPLARTLLSLVPSGKVIDDIYKLEGYLGKNYGTILSQLETYLGRADRTVTDPNLELILSFFPDGRELQKLFKKNKRADSLAARALRINTRFAGKFRKIFEAAFGTVGLDAAQTTLTGTGIRHLFAKGKVWLLTKVFKNSSTWRTAVTQFAAKKLSMKQLVTVGLNKLLTALGIGAAGAGPPGWLVSAAVWVVSLFTDKIVKGAIKLSFFSMRTAWAIVIIVFFLVISCGWSSIVTMDPHANIAPGEAQSRGAGGNIEIVDDGGDYTGPEGTKVGTFYGNEQPIPDYFYTDYACPNESINGCAQGSGGSPGSSHHGKGNPYSAIDYTPPHSQAFKAPADGVVTYYKSVNYCGDTRKSYGGHLQFVTKQGDTFVFFHADLVSGLRVGSSVSQGEDLAVMTLGLPESACWTGPHFHIEIKSPDNYRYSCIEDWFYFVCSGFPQCNHSNICRTASDIRGGHTPR